MGWSIAAGIDRGGLTMPTEYTRDRWGRVRPCGVVATRWDEEEGPLRRRLATAILGVTQDRTINGVRRLPKGNLIKDITTMSTLCSGGALQKLI